MILRFRHDGDDDDDDDYDDDDDDDNDDDDAAHRLRAKYGRGVKADVLLLSVVQWNFRIIHLKDDDDCDDDDGKGDDDEHFSTFFLLLIFQYKHWQSASPGWGLLKIMWIMSGLTFWN